MITPALTRNERGLIIGDERNIGGAYTEQEWRKKLCEGDDSLLQRKIDKIKERENKKKERENKKEKEKSRQRRLDAEYTKAKKRQKEIRFEALEEAFPDTEAKSKNITINPRPPPAKKAPSVPLTQAELRERMITFTKEPAKKAVEAPAKKAVEAPAKKAVDLEIEKARDFVFNFKPKRVTKKYKRELNINARILMKPFQKEQDEIYEKLETQLWFRGSRYRDDARRTFNEIVNRAEPYNEAQTSWILEHNIPQPFGFY